MKTVYSKDTIWIVMEYTNYDYGVTTRRIPIAAFEHLDKAISYILKHKPDEAKTHKWKLVGESVDHTEDKDIFRNLQYESDVYYNEVDYYIVPLELKK